MLHIDIISVGSLRESYWKDACQEYLKRNRKYYHLEMIEIREELLPDAPSQKQIEDSLEKEAERIKTSLKPSSYTIACSPKGNQFDSLQFAQMLQSLPLKGFSYCSFLIGGSWGMSSSLLEACSQNLSFSEMTFPHQLFRLLLLEQLFRSAKINHHETYHK